MRSAEVLMAGFGGQGILLTGKLLAHAAMEEGMQVSWLPSYGPEMRGGTANVTVCISEKPIGSPLVSTPSVLSAMNQPSLEKFGHKVVPGGLIIVDETLIPIKIERDDCTVLYIEATKIATELGAKKAANIVMFGALAGLSDLAKKQTCLATIEKEFARKPKFVPINLAAFERGYKMGRARRAS